MEAFQTRLLRLTPVALPRIDEKKVLKDGLSLFHRMEILDDTSNRLLLAMTWREEKRVVTIDPHGDLAPIIYLVQRQGMVRVDYRTGLVLTRGMGPRLWSLTNLLFPEHSLESVPIQLTNMLKPMATQIAGAQYTDVIVSELPVDLIPSAALRVQSCSRQALKHLLAGTPAVLDRLTFTAGETHELTVSRNGVVRVSGVSEDDWPVMMDVIVDTLTGLGLLEAKR